MLKALFLAAVAANVNMTDQLREWGAYETPALTECPELIAPVHSIDSTSRYCQDDPTRSTVCNGEPAEVKRHLKEFTNALNAFQQDALSANAGAKPLACYYHQLRHWANNDAITSYPIGTENGEYERMMALVRVTESYLQVAHELEPCVYCAGDLPAIKQWLYAVAEGVQGYVANNVATGRNAAQNNHRYWSGVALANVAAITQDDALLAMAKTAFGVGVSEITDAGYLPREIARGKQAMAYHFYAIAALAALHDKLQANGLTTAYDAERLDLLYWRTYGTYFADIQSSNGFTTEMFEEVNACSSVAAGLEIIVSNTHSTHAEDYKDYLRILRGVCQSTGRTYYSTLGGDVSLGYGIKF